MGNIYKKKYTSPPSLACPLEVCHPHCACVKTGKGMLSNTIMSIKMF